MGLRTRLARWLNGSAPTPPDPSASVARDPNAPTLEQRVAQLELERPAFILELNNLLESAQDILSRADSKRGRLAAEESRRKKAETASEEPALPLDRSAVLAQVRARMRANGQIP